MRLLIVEDDPHIAEVLLEGLQDAGYECTHAANATEGAAIAELFPFAGMIIDIMLPEGAEAGFDLAQRLRQANRSLPILFLTARTSIEDRVYGLELGADDYLVKPFAYSELLARVRAMLRRSEGVAQNVINLGFGWQLDISARVVSKAGQAAELTRREFGLLELFALNAGRVFERSEIIERLWSGEEAVEFKVIDLYVSLVRRKTDERLLETVRGIGYRLGRYE